MRACIVAAVSTTAQASEERYSIPQQLDLCRGMCAQRGWQVVSEIAIKGHSRAYNWLDELCQDCPEYAALLRTIRAGDTDLVVCRDYDRLWRTDALRAQVMAVTREHRVQIYAINQPVEPVDPALLGQGSDSSLIISAVSGVVSQLENESRKRRTAMGMRGRIARGLAPGASKAPYGYARVDKHLVVNEAEAVWVRWIFARRAEGWGMFAIVLQLNAQGIPAPRGGVWHNFTVRGILHNPTYIGHVRLGEQHNPHGQHEAIITADLWQRCEQVEQAQRGRFPATPGDPTHILAGLVRCGLCGWSMTYTSRRGAHALICAHYAHTGGRACRPNTVRALELEGYVLYALRTALDNPLVWAAAQREDKEADTSSELSALQSAHGAGMAKWERWNRLYEAGGIDANELLTHRAELQTAQATLQARITAIESAAQQEASRHNQLMALAPTLDRLDALPPAELTAIYRSLIGHIEIHPGYPPLIEWL